MPHNTASTWHLSIFNLSSVTTALVNASQRGVKVRVVLDLVNGTHELKASKSTDRQAFDSLQTLKAAHIQSRGWGTLEWLDAR